MSEKCYVGLERECDLSPEEEELICFVADNTRSIDQCELILTEKLSALFPGKFWIYKGDNHLAIHRETGVPHKGSRLAVIRDNYEI